MGATVLLTIALLLTMILTVLGRIPGRIFYLIGTAISGVCLVAGILRADMFTIVMQAGAFGCWCASLSVRKLAAQLRATR